jgi:hypothetical protein
MIMAHTATLIEFGSQSSMRISAAEVVRRDL